MQRMFRVRGGGTLIVSDPDSTGQHQVWYANDSNGLVTRYSSANVTFADEHVECDVGGVIHRWDVTKEMPVGPGTKKMVFNVATVKVGIGSSSGGGGG